MSLEHTPERVSERRNSEDIVRVHTLHLCAYTADRVENRLLHRHISSIRWVCEERILGIGIAEMQTLAARHTVQARAPLTTGVFPLGSGRRGLSKR